MYQRILLTLDGSELARAAIPHAGTIAGGGAAEVTVLEVLPSGETMRTRALSEGYDFTAGDLDAAAEFAVSQLGAMRREAERELAAAESQLLAAGVGSVTTAIVDGLAGNAIVEYAAQHGIGAIVMATRGHSGLGREVLGSVAEYVLRHAGDAAIVLVGPRSKGPAG